MRQPAADVGDRIDDVLAVGLQSHGEVAAAHGVEPWPGGHHLLGRLDADLAPFVDQPGADDLVGLVDVAVEELERQVLLPRFLEQPPGLGARLLDVGPVADQLLQLLLGCGQRRAGEDDAADGLYDGDLRQRLRALPLVDGQEQGLAHAHVVERLLLVIGRHHVAAVPVALLHRDLVAEFLLQLVARRRRQSPEFHGGAVGANGIRAHGLLGREDRHEAIEVGLARVIDSRGCGHP